MASGITPGSGGAAGKLSRYGSMYGVMCCTYGSLTGVTVEDELLVHQPDTVARNPDRPLHQVFVEIHGVAQDDDIAAAHVAIGE